MSKTRKKKAGDGVLGLSHQRHMESGQLHEKHLGKLQESTVCKWKGQSNHSLDVHNTYM